MKNRHLLSHVILKLAMPLAFVKYGAPSCYVNPNESVVIVGEMTSIDCIAIGPYYVDSWTQGKAITEGTKIYQVPAYRRDGTIRINESLADGYFLSYKEDHRITLQMNETSLWQAGPYFCKCEGSIYVIGEAKANIGVIDLLPSFTLQPRKNITEGDRVYFICSISFNGSANASFDIFINDSNGKTLSRQLNLPFSIDKKSYQVNHSVIADPTKDQTYTCTVKVINGSSKGVIYSKTVNASLIWEPVSDMFISINTRPTSLGEAHPGDKLCCNTNGRPKPTVFKWLKISDNGKSNANLTENGTKCLVLDEIGHFTYRCYAYNVIRNVTHEAFSSNFDIIVEEQYRNSAITVATVGIVVFILVIVFVIFLCAIKRKHQNFIIPAFVRSDSKNRQVHIYNKEESPKEEISIIKQPVYHQAACSTHNTADSEVFLCDNELYGVAKRPLDPSDGYAAEMPYYATINKV